MATYQVTVKWGKEKFEDVEVNTGEKPLLFKAQLFALTGVEPARQKVLFKGKMLNDESWEGFSLKNGSLFMMMGTVGELPAAMTEKAVFFEDLSHEERSKALNIPAGLVNLGNTCYMSATIQCLKTVKELTNALRQCRSKQVNRSSCSLLHNLANLFQAMDDNVGTEVLIVVTLDTLLSALPQFGAKDSQGRLQQQDANELWMELMRLFKEQLCGENVGLPPGRSLITTYFGGVMEVTLSCKEAPDEPPIRTTEEFLQLSCFLSQEVKYLHLGLKAKMSEEIIKHSPTLDRDAIYTRRCAVQRLPAYLTIQMVRFFYKEKDQVNAKILKDVKFPFELDLYDLCSEGLQKKLMPARNLLKLAMEKEMQNGEQKNGERQTQETAPDAGSQLIDDVGSCCSGIYELQAVLTHKGRSSNSGHYVAWIKKPNDMWFSCDDDVVRPVDKEEILRLSGGGDWHCAYVLLYASKNVGESVNSGSAPAASTGATKKA